MSRIPMKVGSALGSANTGGAWLSSARVVRCWVKSRNERNPRTRRLLEMLKLEPWKLHREAKVTES
ncbi:hypothetical protein AB0758_24085 [Tolypothrix bouteillei VB521301_2]|uniref:hypothetical protein n=1 Tax=Tolypothrix bouteillei TaxID=1246981 RepID=UPI0038B51D85